MWTSVIVHYSLGLFGSACRSKVIYRLKALHWVVAMTEQCDNAPNMSDGTMHYEKFFCCFLRLSHTSVFMFVWEVSWPHWILHCIAKMSVICNTVKCATKVTLWPLFSFQYLRVPFWWRSNCSPEGNEWWVLFQFTLELLESYMYVSFSLWM